MGQDVGERALCAVIWSRIAAKAERRHSVEIPVHAVNPLMFPAWYAFSYCYYFRINRQRAVEVDANGYLQAIYDIGFTKTIYQIPVADVPNMNGLISQNNQTFEVSPESGSLFLWDAGEGPTGDMAGFTREESATDVAAELTQLIQTQRAYSSNAKVIQTVDEMLQETTNIKR